MGCTTACLCNCGQIACGCHLIRKGSAGTATKTELPGNTQCPSCGGRARGQVVRSPLGRVVTAVFCGRWDVASPRR